MKTLGPDVRIHHLAAQFCLAALSGQSPEARQGRASLARGIDGESALKNSS
jgi:hypothetical protein